MTSRGRLIGTNAASLAAAWMLAGCGQDAPPYEELPLRDALRAAPEVVATLPFEARRELALRLDAAGLDQDGATMLELPDTATIDSLARVADEAREEEGQDALVVGEIFSQANEFVVHAEIADEAALDGTAVGPIFLRGQPGAETKPFEDAALQGRAGKWLRELSARADTKQMVRTTGLPMGAWAFDDTLYVNASWLVAMSALEQGVSAPAMASGQGTATAPGKKPLSVDFNPYNLPGSLAECAVQVETTCQCGTSCDHDVTDPTFSSAVDECAWVNQNALNSSALCVLALLSIDAVRACMESAAAQCSALPVTTRDDALLFVQNTTCMDLLDMCLQDGYIPRPSSGGGSSCNSCSDNSGSSDGCSSCNNDCSRCNDNCSQCNQNVSDCNQNCSNANSNANNCGKCNVKPAPGRSPLPAPVGTTFWLLAPVAYLLLRGRRRS